MIHRGVEVEDTYCKATDLHVSRVALTAITSQVTLDEAVYLSGFSIIIAAAIQVCVERVVAPERTPDGRPGVLVQLCAPIVLGIRKFKRAVADRLYILPHLHTRSLFDASPKVQEPDTVDIGSRLSRWWDGFESKGTVGNREAVRIPVMAGEMIVECQLRAFHGLDAVLGVFGANACSCLVGAREAASRVFHDAPGMAVFNFPSGGISGISGAKVGGRTYVEEKVTNNESYCPTLRCVVGQSFGTPDVGAVMEFLPVGEDETVLRRGLGLAIDASADTSGILRISAPKFGGQMGSASALPGRGVGLPGGLINVCLRWEAMKTLELPLALGNCCQAFLMRLVGQAQELGVTQHTLPCGARVVDAALEAEESYEAGRLIVEILQGGLSSTSLGMVQIGGYVLPELPVESHWPVLSAYRLQISLQLPEVDVNLLVSGPIRLWLDRETDLSDPDQIGDWPAVAILDWCHPVGDDVAVALAARSGLRPSDLVLVSVPPGSIAGTTQIAGRINECVLLSLERSLGIDSRLVCQTIGRVPVAPPLKPTEPPLYPDDLIYYAGSAALTISGLADIGAQRLAGQLRFRSTPIHGRLFRELLSEAGEVFEHIPHLLHINKPAMVSVLDLRSGHIGRAGAWEEAILARAMEDGSAEVWP